MCGCGPGDGGRDGLGTAGVMVGPSELRGFSQTKWFHDSVHFVLHPWIETMSSAQPQLFPSYSSSSSWVYIMHTCSCLNSYFKYLITTLFTKN